MKLVSTGPISHLDSLAQVLMESVTLFIHKISIFLHLILFEK